jgi:hypothetical protein
MKTLLRAILASLLLFAFAPASLAQTPQFRPALLGHHKRSLVNLIDTQSLMKRGQGNAVVMFSCVVGSTGFGGWSRCYRGSPDSEMFQKELMARIDQAQFEPAIYNGSKVAVYLSGTANFFVKDGKPHLRIFLNQEDADLQAGRDFVAPQYAFAPGNMDYKGIFYPPDAPRQGGVVSLKLDVTAQGVVTGSRVAYEYPPGKGFGAYAAGPVLKANFIPGFRDGKPVATTFTWNLIFTGPGRQMKTG